jgi:hypothetical protein
MHRLAVLLLCSSLAAFAAWAAPAPVYKPDRTRWLGVTGWDRPACQGASCTRHGDRLSVSMPPPAHGQKRSFALTRNAEGDFTLVVRLKLNLRHRSDEGFYRAGITLSAGTTSVDLGLSAHGTAFFRLSRAGGGTGQSRSSSTMETPDFFRLTRRAGTLLAEYSYDGGHWECFNDAATEIDLPRKVKVGVFAMATADGTCEPVFDQFSLTPLK